MECDKTNVKSYSRGIRQKPKNNQQMQNTIQDEI